MMDHTVGPGLQPRAKLWLERDGKLVLSDYRVRLLELVRETGSLAQAATRMRLSYRRAWGKLKELEQNLGVALVTSEVGGAGGGHTALTAEGERLLTLYQEFRRQLESAIDGAYRATFGAERPR